jgi:sugar (pentulose or hexulose) kinase
VLVGAGDDVELLGAERRAACAVEHLGTTASILASLDGLRLDPAGRVEVYPAAVAARYACGASTPNGGAVVAWLERALGVGTDEALSSEPAGDGPVVLPHLYGERGSRASPLGRGAVLGLHPSHTAVDIARAFLVAIAFGLRDLVGLVAPLVGPVETIVTSGGGGGSAAWLRLRAAAYRRPLHVLSADPTALGCAALGLAELRGGSPAEAAASLVVDDVVVEPDERLAARLEGPYEAQRALLSRVAEAQVGDHSAAPSLAPT